MLKKAGFTLIELLVVVSIIALLVSIMMPALAQVRAQAQSAVCKVNLRSVGQAIEIYKSDLDLTVDEIWQWGGGTADNFHEWHEAGVHQSLVEDFEILPDREVFFCPSVQNLAFDHNYLLNNKTPMDFYQIQQLAPAPCVSWQQPWHDAWAAKVAKKNIVNHFYFWSSYIWLWKKVDYRNDETGRINMLLQVNHASDDYMMGDMSPSVYGFTAEKDVFMKILNIAPPINHYNALFADGHVEQVASTDIEYNYWMWGNPYWAGDPQYGGW